MLKVMKVAIIAVVMLVSGCQALVNNGIRIYPEHWTSALTEVRPRAVIDLSCHPTTITFTLLKRIGKEAASIEARGCGNVVIYARRVGHWSGAREWTVVTSGRSPYQAGEVHNPVEVKPTEPALPENATPRWAHPGSL